MSLPPPLLPSCLLLHLLPKGLLLPFPPCTPLEEVIPCLSGTPAPPALCCPASFHPLQVLACPAVAHLQLVELWGKPLSASSNHAVWPPAFWHLVLPLEGMLSSPLPCLYPLLLGDLQFDVGKGSGEQHQALLWSVPIVKPL